MPVTLVTNIEITLDEVVAAVSVYNTEPSDKNLAKAWRNAFLWFHAMMQRPDQGKVMDALFFAEYEQGMKEVNFLLKQSMLHSTAQK